MSDHGLGGVNDGLGPGFPPGGVPDPFPPGGGWSGPPGSPAWPGSGPDPRAAPVADALAPPGAPAPAVTAGPARRRRRPPRLARGVALTLLVAAGLAAIGGGGAGPAPEPTPAAAKGGGGPGVQAGGPSTWQPRGG